MKAYPLHFPEKAPKGTKQGAKLPEVLIQGREISVFLAFSRFPARITRIEQDLRRRTLYTTELLEHILEYCSGKYNGCQPQVSAVFCPLLPYTVFLRRKEDEKMRECSDPNVDLEDLLFDDDAGGPSER